MTITSATRRCFNKATAVSAAASLAWPADLLADPYTSRVALTKGMDRADNAFRAMQVFKREIAAAIGKKRIIVKPNVVQYDNDLADTHADWLEGILEFLKSIGRTDVYIAESPALGSTMAGFEHLGYLKLSDRYPVKFIDLNQEGSTDVQVWKDASSLWTIRVSRILRNPDNFIISCPRIKTHNGVVATCSMKNVVMGAPTVNVGAFFLQPGTVVGKWGPPSMHGVDNADYQLLNDNLYRLVKVYGIQPHLAVIDGYEGMQGDGPVAGYAAPRQYLGICSLDWVAADRVCVRLMGHDQYTLNALGPYPACLNYCGQAGFGEWDISKIQVIGESVDANIVNYTPNPSTLNGALLVCRSTPKE